MRLWTMLCGNSEQLHVPGNKWSSGFLAIINPYSCANHILVISIDILLFFSVLLTLVFQAFSKKLILSRGHSAISISTAFYNGCLGFLYLVLGIWKVEQKVQKEDTVFPMHGWLVVLAQGFTWVFISSYIILCRQQHPFWSKSYSIMAILLATFLCTTSVLTILEQKFMVTKLVLDILSFPGALLLISTAFERCQCKEIHGCICENDASYTALPGEEASTSSKTVNARENLTPFANAGNLSKMCFWWLNPLIKVGRMKILEGEDIPQLRVADQAETCYLQLTEQLNKMKKKNPTMNPSILRALFLYHWKDILVSGIFALIKVLTLTTGPLFLNAFIEVAGGKESFKYEGYALTAGFFLAKCLESISERQWCLITRLSGLQVKSSLTAAIYHKQLKLSNAAKETHSPGQIMNYVTVDADKVGEFPFWFHQFWTTSLQFLLVVFIVYYSVGLATIVTLISVILTALANFPIAKSQLRYQTNFMVEKDRRLKAITETLTNMKILKLYAWEKHFLNVINELRKGEMVWLSALISQRGCYMMLFWTSPTIISAATFLACYFLRIPLFSSNVFTFLSCLRLVQEPTRRIPDVIGAFIDAKVSLSRIVEFLEAPELHSKHDVKRNCNEMKLNLSLSINSSEISWSDLSKPTLRNINLVINQGEKIAICGEVGSGKSALLALILGEVPYVNGKVQVCGRMAHVSQTAWIQTGSIQENILFGSAMDQQKYQLVIEKSSLVKDLEMLPFGDLTEIGERGINLSGGQKQRVQLARALYQDADIYLLDDPFSAVDAHTASKLFNDYVMGALMGKTVLLVTHQVEFLPAFDSILLISGGEILRAGTFDELLTGSLEFQGLVNAHSSYSATAHQGDNVPKRAKYAERDSIAVDFQETSAAPRGDQLIKKEEREIGNTGFKPYLYYLHQGKGFLYFSLIIIAHLLFVIVQYIQNYLLASGVQDIHYNRFKLVLVYFLIGCVLVIALIFRSLFLVGLAVNASKSIFYTLSSSLFSAPMSFFDSTPVGRILSRVSSDMNSVDLEVPIGFTVALAGAVNVYATYGILALLTWQVLFVIAPMICLTIILQRYYNASARELMRLNGTTKSSVASHLSESISGAMTIRAFGGEESFFSKSLILIDQNAKACFHSFAAVEWLVQRLEVLGAIVLSSWTLFIVSLHQGTFSSGFVGMVFSYGLSLNLSLVVAAKFQCSLENSIVSVERLEQYMRLPSEALDVIQSNRPSYDWPAFGRVEICNLRVRYRPSSPLVLHGISCIFEGGEKIGVVGRTGSGKTTLISALFRLVEPAGGKIIIDDVDISTVGLHDLRSRIGIIPQDPTLFNGTVRYNLDPLSQHSDMEIWEVLNKCQLKEAVQEKEEGLDCIVLQDGSNWSMGQRQLFCLGRALLKRSRILVLDEATASIDNATDLILQRTIRVEFTDCTVITIAHRIPTVMDCSKVLSITDGKLVEFDQPEKLMTKEGSLFGELVKEYWARAKNAGG
ncbi:hypothetical protein ACH5RR_038361 [Cinchona calisaya]|uniref:ABC-type xenobiotic transporter n=1 Tax=Cinchona calisaya TaxID=153742 RepID=A0ABD2XWF1_9GENT